MHSFSRHKKVSSDPRSGSSFLVPDATYRFIRHSPPSEKEASLNPGIIYTIIFNIGPGNTGPKTCNSLKSTFKGGGSTENPRKLLPCAGDRPWSAWYGHPSCRVCSFFLWQTLIKFLKARWDASPNPRHYTRGTCSRVCPAVLNPTVIWSTST